MNKKPTISVIGAGVIGLSIARSLVQKGAEVTLFERRGIGAGTSSQTYAWVNANGKSPEAYHELNLGGMREHEELQENGYSEAQWFFNSGTYEWAVDDGKGRLLEQRVENLKLWDYPVETVTGEQLKSRVPEIKVHPHSGTIWYFPTEGYLWPEVFLARLWSEAKELGVTLRVPADVVDVIENRDGATLSLSSGETFTSDYVVSATGRWSENIVNMLGREFAIIDATQPNRIACGFLGHTAPQYVQLQSNLITPHMNIRPNGAGRLLLQVPDLDDRADPSYHADPDGLIGREMLQRLQSVLENTELTRIEGIRVGQRARPADGKPAVGFVTDMERVYVVTTHSGMTLAPYLSKLVAGELVDERVSDLLQSFRPGRLLDRRVEDFAKFSTIHFPAAQ